MHLRIDRKKNKDGSVREYLQIVQSVRKKGSKYPAPKIIANLGRLDQIKNGRIDALIEGLSKYTVHMKTIDMQKDLFLEESMLLGPRLIVQHIWKKLGLDNMLQEAGLPESTQEYLFQMVLARIHDPVSKRKTHRQLHRFALPDEPEWSLSTMYRSLTRLEPLIKKIEDNLFEKQYGSWEQDDFFDPVGLDLVFFDTTSVATHTYEEDLFDYGYSRDHRPDLPQFVVGLVMSSNGDPLCQYLFPGNLTDAIAFEEALTEVYQRFPLKRIILVADRGCVNGDLLNFIRDLKIEYIVGAKMRTDKAVRDEVLGRGGRYTVYDSNLSYKVVREGPERFLLVKNKKQAERDAYRRTHILDELKKKEGHSLKGLAGNKGYSRYLKNTGRIEVDEDRVKADARYDGKWVIRTNTQDFSGTDLLEAYKMLVNVEQWFSFLKHVVDVKPVYHRLSTHIRSHVFICFLGMKVWHVFRERLSGLAPDESAYDVWMDLEELKGAVLEVSEERWLVRTDFAARTDLAFKSVGAARPARIRKL